jgi:type I restriction enzyme S subunit
MSKTQVTGDGNSLPLHWESGLLSDYVEPPDYGYTDSASLAEIGPRFLRISDIQGGAVDWNTVPFCSCPPDVLARKKLESGDIVVARIGATTGKSFFIELCQDSSTFASYLIRIRPRPDRLLPKYLYYYMQSALYWSHIDSHKEDRLKGGVNIPVLLSLPLFVPPRDEQEQIVRALTHVYTACNSEAGQHKNASALKRAVMRALFTRGLRREPQKETEIGLLPSSWPTITLGSLGRIGNGSTPKKSRRQYWDGGTFPWLTSAKVYDREIESADQFVTSTALRECHLPQLRPGTVLIAITGQGKTLGHCAVLRMHATINQHLAYLDTDTSLANPSFVRGYLETQYDYLRQVASGGGSTKGALTCAFLRELKVPLPTLKEQDTIAAILNAMDQKIEVHTKKRTVFAQLFALLTHKLMSGEIRVSDLNISALERASNAQVLA